MLTLYPRDYNSCCTHVCHQPDIVSGSPISDYGIDYHRLRHKWSGMDGRILFLHGGHCTGLRWNAPRNQQKYRTHPGIHHTHRDRIADTKCNLILCTNATCFLLFIFVQGIADEWSNVFLLFGGLYALAGIVFLLTGSAELQSWGKAKNTSNVLL